MLKMFNKDLNSKRLILFQTKSIQKQFLVYEMGCNWIDFRF